jgi:hypothetical protein
VQGILNRLGVPFLFGNLQVLNTQDFHKSCFYLAHPSLGAVALFEKFFGKANSAVAPFLLIFLNFVHPYLSGRSSTNRAEHLVYIASANPWWKTVGGLCRRLG